MPQKILNLEKLTGEEKRRIITLIVTRDCNLKCEYCYEKFRNNDGKVMDIELAKDIIIHYMKKNDGFSEIEIEFFGGEPMLFFSFIKNIVEWFYTQNWKKKHIFMICTNGTILNDEMKNWLYKYRKTVVVAFSIDGNKKSHDISRCNSYDSVYKNLLFFIENWPRQPAKMTIGSNNIPHMIDSIKELEKLGVNFTANLVLEDIWGDNKSKEKLLQVYQDQLEKIVDFYFKNPDLDPVAPLLSTFPEYLGTPDKGEKFAKGLERYCGAGYAMTAIDLDGKVYSCHRFLPWVTGIDAPYNIEIKCEKGWSPDQCLKCKIFQSCPTCAGHNWAVNGNVGKRTIYHCEAHKMEILASAQLVAKKYAKMKQSDFKIMSNEKRKKLKLGIETIFELLDEGI